MAQYNAGGYQQQGYGAPPPYAPGYGPPPHPYPQYAPPPQPYYAPPPPAAAPVVVNISNNQTQKNSNNGNGNRGVVVAAPPSRAAAPRAPVASVLGIVMSLNDPGNMSPQSLVDWMADAASKAYEKLENGETSSGDLVKLMSKVLVAVESLTIKLSVGHKHLVAQDNFRAQFLTAVRSVQRLIEAARERTSCCCSNYMGDSKLRNISEKVWQKLATFSMDNFRLDLSSTGHVGIVGHSGVDYKQSMQAVHEVDTVQAIVPGPLVQTADERAPLVQNGQPGYGAF